MITLWQAEWCPHSATVRARLTDLGIDYVTRQVPDAPADRTEMREATGHDRIPTLVLEDGTVIPEEREILRWLDEEHAGARA